MHIDGYVKALREDLTRIAAVGDEGTVRAAELLGVALEASLGRRMQEALAEAALELSSQLEHGHVEVRVAGGDPELVYVDEAAPAPAEPAADATLDARITLRLSEALKSRLESAASSGGVSVNTWLVQTLGRVLLESTQPSARGRGRGGNRLTGYGRA